MSQAEKNRAILYVDGFNLYYAIHALKANHLKWLNLAQLGARICSDRGHNLVGVTYCTAYQKGDPEKLSRHKSYIEALQNTGLVTLELGHYLTSPSDPCRNCGAGYDRETEKQTDINLALGCFSDALKDKFDWAYMLSADSDQASTFKFMKQYFPEKKMVTVVPPGHEHSTSIASLADGKRKLNMEDIEKCRFPSIIMRDGALPIRCPKVYDLPVR